jgi:hypothetical protein
MLFPNSRGRHIDFRSFGRRHWKTAQIAAGIEPVRHLYDLRHTYATFALRAGVSVFAVSRFMGSSIAMIDRHYGHLARNSREHAVSLLDALAIERAVDAGWTSQPNRAKLLSESDSGLRRRRPQGMVDARWTSGLATPTELVLASDEGIQLRTCGSRFGRRSRVLAGAASGRQATAAHGCRRQSGGYPRWWSARRSSSRAWAG